MFDSSDNLNPVRALKPLKVETAEQKKLFEASKEFESIFITQVLKQMRESVQTTDPLNQGSANKLYREMLDEEMGKSMAASGGIGLADSIYRQLYTGV